MNIVNAEIKFSGWYKIEAVKPDGSVRTLADWFPNLITNQGLDRMGVDSNYYNFCQVGSGATAPANTDTALVSIVAGTSTRYASATSTAVTIPGTPDTYYVAVRNFYQFAVGVAAGNLQEIGTGWAATGSVLFSRALILDGGGLPTTITVLIDEILQVTYEFRVYPPVVDVVGTIVISAVSYDYTLRAAGVTTPFSIFGSNSDPNWGNGEVGTQAGHASGGVGNKNACFPGAIGAITSFPTGSANSGLTGVNAAYGSNSLFRDCTITASISIGNVPGGIKSQTIPFQWGTYQIEFTPVLPKTNLKVYTITFRQTWSRAVI